MRRLWLVVAACAFLAGACAGRGRFAEPPTATGPRLAAVPVTAAEQARAAELLAAARDAFAAGDLAAARALAEEVVERLPGTSAAVPALWLAAEAAYGMGDHAAAAAHAERYASVFPPGSAEAERGRQLAARAAEALAARPTGVLGAILPQSGSPVLSQYAELVLEGIRLGVDRFNAETGGNVELVVLDDGGDSERASALLRDLEARGVFGVIGPLLAPSIVAAAQARSGAGLAIVSPLEDMTPWQLRNVLSLSSVDTRGAEALAAYAVSAGLRRVAILYPRTREYERQAEAFAEAVRSAGGQVVAQVPYEQGTTTFAQHLLQIRSAAPAALFIPAPVRDIRQLAPQFAYYGLTELGLQILGSEEWASEELLRVIEPQHVEGVVAATPFLPESDVLAWREFVGMYENAYRRSLANPVPALGYDAARLLLLALAGDPAPAGVSNRLEALADVRGATGVLTVADGRVERTPFLVRIRDREPIPLQGAGR